MGGEALQLLGVVQLRRGTTLHRFLPDQRYLLLVYLGYCGDWVSRDHLTYLFWPDKPSRDAHRSSRQLLHRVRAFSWVQNLEVERQRLRWSVGADVYTLRQAVKNA